MVIQYIGHSCFKFKTKSATVLIDPFDAKIGKHFPKQTDVDLLLCTHAHFDHHNLEGIASEYFLIDGPGEYDIKDITVRGVSSFHDKKKGEERGLNTIYTVEAEDIVLCHLGDIGDVLTDEQLETLGPVQVLFVPVGGKYTVDADDAIRIISQIEPSVVIPMHYGNAELGLSDVSVFLKQMGVEAEPVKTVKFTSDDFSGNEEGPRVIVMQSY